MSSECFRHGKMRLGDRPATRMNGYDPIALWEELADGFVAFSTSRHFDNDLATPWDEAGRRLLSMARERGGPVADRLFLAQQVHGSRVASTGERARESGPVALLENCDGIVTAGEGIWLAIRTADCFPITLVDETARVCAALHAGWRGTLANIMGEGIAAMEHLGARAGRIAVWIGPGISATHYEVSRDLAREFERKCPGFKGILDGRHLHLAEVNRQQALLAGVCGARIRASEYCTFTHEGLFHSHRRQGSSRGHQFMVCGFNPR